MKIKVEIPKCLIGNGVILEEKRQEFIDDILLWGMEVGMDIAVYAVKYDADYSKPLVRGDWQRNAWAVFTVEPDSAFMFCLKWGAVQYKGKKKHDFKD